MGSYVVKNEIESKLKNIPQHPLNSVRVNYKKELLENLNELYKGEILKSTKNLNALTNRLQLSNFNEKQYYQGISEIVFEVFPTKTQNIFFTEKKLRSDRNTDVDIQIVKNGYNFNFEIKTPEFKENNADTFYINTAFRSVSKESLEKAKVTLQDEIITPILIKSDKYENYEFTKINDNKMLDYLKSAQEKFVYSDSKTLNVLVVSVCTNEMQDYWDYLFNSFTGLFTDSTYDNLGNYDKVDIVLLTNIVSGHLGEIKGAWDLKNYCNLFFPNPYCEKFSTDLWKELYCELLNLIPNHTYEFDYFLMELEKEMNKAGINLHGLIFDSFISEKFPEFSSI